MKRFSLRMPLMLAGVAAIAGLAMGASSPAAQAAPAQQTLTCAWSSVGNSSLNAWSVASAMDTDKNVMYVYSGLDDKLDVISKAEKYDFSKAKKPSEGSISGVGGSAPALYGVTAAYRAKGADSDMSAVYWFGGASDSGSGTGSNTITELKTKSGSWNRVNGVTGDTLLGNRYWASAAYDPMGDVIWIVGGLSTCSLKDVANNKPCTAKSIPTLYMKWDDKGVATLNTLSGGNQSIYGAKMVYDSANKRMLISGGSSDGSRGLDKVTALSLDPADPTKAKFSTVSTTGSAQLSFLGAAAYWGTNKWLVNAGGASTAIFLAGENANSKTIGLNMADPAKAAWVDLKAQANDRVGAVAEYAMNASGLDAIIISGGRAKLTANIVDATTGAPGTTKITRGVQGLTCTTAAVPPTATTGPIGPTRTPGTGPTSEVPIPTVPLNDTPEICESVKSRVPNAVINDAVAAPDKVGGYKMACNPNLPAGQNNPLRRYLGLRNPNNVYHPIFNSLVWKCSCP